MSPALFLIGPRACGKSSLGRALAERWGWEFLDADAELERRSGRRIAAWIPADLEGFRDAEERLLQEWLSLEDRVVALGGGVVERDASVERLAAHPCVLALTAPVAELAARQEGGDRPALTGLALEEEVRTLLEARRDHYDRAASGRWVETGGDADAAFDRLLQFATKICR